MAEHVVLLINLGTPDAPDTASVRRYLREFLTDARVLDGPAPLRWLVGGVIIPLSRAAGSAAAYRSIWREDTGSPLAHHLQALATALQGRLGDDWEVIGAMRYGRPALRTALDALRQRPLRQLVLVPLYPQYASSSTGSTLELALSHIARWETFPERLDTIGSFHDSPGFIELWAEKLRAHLSQQTYDRVLFSFHGLPESHIRRSHCAMACGDQPCPPTSNAQSRLCYRSACYATARAIAANSEVAEQDWELCFQSRLSKGWLKPFTDVRVQQLAQEGARRLLVLCPAFVADCLETEEEVGIRLKKDFLDGGGKELVLVPSLNADAQWVEVLAQEILPLRGASGPDLAS